VAIEHPNDEELLEGEDGVSDETIEDMRQRDIRADLGANYDTIARSSPLKRKIFEFIYAPKVEICIFVLIVFSILLLIIEVSLPISGPVDWLGGRDAKELKSFFFNLDVVFSVAFLFEYLIKLWIAPRKWYFIKTNWIDLLAIFPVLRVFRIGRAVRLLRLLRLLRLMRVGQLMQQRVSGMSDELQRRSAENLIIMVYLLFSLIFGTVGVMVFEKGHNDGFQTLGDGLWWCVVTLTTVGYGDISPQTTGGKIVAVIIMFIGLSFYALLTGLLSTIIIERTKKNEAEGMEISNLSKHVVICGWNETGKRLVSDLIESERDPHVVVLYHESKYPRLLDPNIYYLEEDPTTARGLDRARVKHASVAVVLPDLADGRSSQDADARSILTILAIEQINSNIHTIVELLNDENTFHVRNAGCDEVIVSGSYTGTMLSQVVQFPGVSDVFGDLFTPGTGSHLKEEMLDTDFFGKKFSEISSALFSKGNGVLVGYRRDGKLELSPSEDVVLQKNDRVIVVRRH